MFELGFFLGVVMAFVAPPFYWWVAWETIGMWVGAREAAVWKRWFWLRVARLARRKADQTKALRSASAEPTIVP